MKERNDFSSLCVIVNFDDEKRDSKKKSIVFWFQSSSSVLFEKIQLPISQKKSIDCDAISQDSKDNSFEYIRNKETNTIMYAIIYLSVFFGCLLVW